ncbi:hypothetical protein ACFPM7_04975 [Actinokineospora guangxiensis]|uniref:4-O-methyl-glucuronoyl methylesterase-like domain-containing protein n=1 Tax=Actinokineospora guangxiensis TaxID=1490288 RepID=A0ABW0EJT2_9PSEU
MEQSGGAILRSDAFGVTGCSRYGKGAFAIGALDQRVALTMPVESGAGGVPAFRWVASESGVQRLHRHPRRPARRHPPSWRRWSPRAAC